MMEGAVALEAHIAGVSGGEAGEVGVGGHEEGPFALLRAVPGTQLSAVSWEPSSRHDLWQGQAQRPWTDN